MVVIAAVDDEGDTHIVEEGAALAEAFNDELHVIHVLSREDVESDAGKGGTETALERAERRAAEIAEETGEEFDAVGRIGRPAQELEDYATSEDARYVVIGGRKRTPIGKALFGSVTQSVLLTVDTPVVAIRAE